MRKHFFDIKRVIDESILAKQFILNDNVLLEDIDKAIDCCVSSLRSGGKIWFAGNGGSAADAQHLAAELSGRFYINRKPLPAEALHVNTSFLTAAANDYGFDKAYARLIEGCARPGDVLVAISTSGNSDNIIEAAQAAQALGVKVIAFTGKNGGKLRNHCDLLINAPSNDTPRIQECHVMIGHILCENIEKELFE